MTLKVTFDTNVFKRFIDLKDDHCEPFYEKILGAIKSGTITGYFSDTFVTLEGVMRRQREKTFGSRNISSSISSDSPTSINIAIGASMSKHDLHVEHLRTVMSLLDLGLRGLRGPAYLGDNFSVPSHIDLYESISTDALIRFREKMHQVELAIARRNQETGKNVSKCRARELGLMWLSRNHRDGEIWYQGLGLCKDRTESKQVVEAIKEWADGESIIRHIGYGNDYFCTSDRGQSTQGGSIFDDDHKRWLACEFGAKFVSPSELVNDILSI